MCVCVCVCLFRLLDYCSPGFYAPRKDLAKDGLAHCPSIFPALVFPASAGSR